MRPVLCSTIYRKVSGLSILFIAFLAVISFSSCRRDIISGSGNVVSEARKVSPFDVISVNAPVKAHIRVSPGSVQSVQLKGYKNLLERIKVEVMNGRLSLSVEEEVVINTDENIIAEIICPDLGHIIAEGTSEIEIEGDIKNKEFTASLGGASDVLINNIATDRFIANISGAARLAVQAGQATHADIKVSGAGNIKAYGLVCSQANANVSGAGFIRLNATQKLNAKITGAGNISYKGTPAITSSVSVAGALKNAN